MKLYNSTIASKAEYYAKNCHESTNHKYNGHPYRIHLEQVVQYANDFSYLLPDEDLENVIAACWVHDTIEDCRQTYNDVKAATNTAVADIAFALTNEKGKTRKERANSKYYAGIRETPFADFVKVCDRLANIFYSKQTNSSMFRKYKSEHDEFMQELFNPKYVAMFDKLDELLEVTPAF